VSDSIGEDDEYSYPLTSKDAMKYAPYARNQMMTAIMEYPFILDDIKKRVKEGRFIYKYHNDPRRTVILLREKILAENPEKPSVTSLQPFVKRYENEMLSYSLSSLKKERQKNYVPYVRNIGAHQFGVKHYTNSYRKWRWQISKVETIPYELIIDKNFVHTIVEEVLKFEWIKKQFKEKISKSAMNSLRLSINRLVWGHIEKKLDHYSWHKTWATAFYLKHYGELNELMEYITSLVVMKIAPEKKINKEVWKSFDEKRGWSDYSLFIQNSKFERL
jgi:hypothetical protein